MRTASFVFVVVGVVLVVGGHGGYMLDKMSTPNRRGSVTAMIPGWSLIIMGWCGLLNQGMIAPTSKPSGSES